MNQPTGSERDFEHAKLLLEEYCFDLSGFQAGELVAIWQERLEAEPSWIRSAVLEALYQGRYKAFSVEQILQAWKRRGHPVRHFNSEFERIVFGPIDPTISKYAAMTSLSPSELMLPQTEAASKSTAAADPATPSSEAAAVPSDDHAGESPSPYQGSNLPAIQTSTEIPQTETPTPAPRPQPPESVEQLSFESWLEPNSNHYSSVFSQPEPIRKFVPQSQVSEFYTRLQSVAKNSQ